jgi:diacylglycerol kinase family enzyme
VRGVERFAQMPKIYKAAHLNHPKIEVHRTRKVAATSAETVLLDVDGEAPGQRPTTFTMLPGALNFKIKD